MKVKSGSRSVAVVLSGTGARRGYAPLLLGIVGALGVVAGKLVLPSDALSYVALAAILAAGVWNSWPAKSESASCTGTCPAVEES